VNRNEFIEKLASRLNLTKRGARQTVDAVFGLITETLSKNEPVQLTGFGKFEPRARRESNRINPQTRERIRVPRKVVPTFKPGKGSARSCRAACAWWRRGASSKSENKRRSL
jgi:DNA-binding protein HU-beta